MVLRLYNLREKIEVIDAEIWEARKDRRAPGSLGQRRYEVLKVIAEDLRASQTLARAAALEDVEEALRLMMAAPRQEGGGYDHNRLIAVANIVIGRWPAIRQAMEKFAEEQVE